MSGATAAREIFKPRAMLAPRAVRYLAVRGLSPSLGGRTTVHAVLLACNAASISARSVYTLRNNRLMRGRTNQRVITPSPTGIGPPRAAPTPHIRPTAPASTPP